MTFDYCTMMSDYIPVVDTPVVDTPGLMRLTTVSLMTARVVDWWNAETLERTRRDADRCAMVSVRLRSLKWKHHRPLSTVHHATLR